MLTGHPLHDLFGGSRSRLLGVLLNTDRELSIRRLAELAGVAPSTASAALEELGRSQIVEAREIAGAHLYRLNREHYAVVPLRQLLETARGLEGELVALLHQMLPGEPPLAVILFGSTARGEEGAADIDLLVIARDSKTRERWLERAPEVGEAASRLVGKRVEMLTSLLPTRGDLRRPFWREVLREGRVLSGIPLSELRVA